MPFQKQSSLSRQKMMAQVNTVLPSLPPEMWTRIFSILDRISLRDIVLCCRQFHELASPLLFSNVFVEYRRNVSEVNAPGSPVDQLRQLVLYLLRTPGFASVVQSIRFRGPSHGDYGSESSIADKVCIRNDPKLQAAIQRYVSRPSNALSNLARNRDSLSRIQFDNDITLHIRLLLGLLPQARSLHVQVPDGRLFEGLSLDSTIFDGLQEMTLEWKPVQDRGSLQSIGGVWPGDHLRDIMSIKSLRKLRFINIRFRGCPPLGAAESSFASLQPRSLAIQQIEFIDSPVDALDSDLLFDAVSGMDTFIYIGQRKYFVNHIPLAVLSHLGTFHGNSLKCIWLEFGTNHVILPRELTAEDSTVSRLGRLRGFTKLKHLCIPTNILFDYYSALSQQDPSSLTLEFLPPSLETIVLLNYYVLTPFPVFTTEIVEFFRILQTRLSSGQSSQTSCGKLKRVVLVSSLKQLMMLPLELLVRIKQIQEPRITFIAACLLDIKDEDIQEGSLLACKGLKNGRGPDQGLDEVCSTEIEDLIRISGQNKLYERRPWHIIDQVALRHRQEQQWSSTPSSL